MSIKTAVRAACAVLSITAAVPPERVCAEEASASAVEPVAPKDSRAEGSPRGRILNGHVFMPAADVPGALVTTSFTSGLLVALGETSGSYTAGNPPQTLSGTFEYAGIGAVIGYEYAFTDYLSARLAVTELLFSGTTGRSAIVIGTEMQGGAGLGLTFSLPVGDALRVAALLDVSATPNFGLTIGTGLASVIDSCEAGTCDLHSGGFFQLKKVYQVQPALAASWAPFAALGVTANASYFHAHQDVNGTTFNGDAVQLGIATDLDFQPLYSIPIGLQAQFSWIAPFGGEGLQHVSDFGGGVFYTGRKNLALGVQVIARRFAVTPGVDVSWKTYLANIGMRYYW